MSFLNSLKSAGKYILDETKNKLEEANAKAIEFQSYSNEELLKLRKRGNIATMMAANKVLKDRGYNFKDSDN